ncbi:inositol 1,4,5-trisphosphate receptor-interacting protein [Neosynchiropus ocellatus]
MHQTLLRVLVVAFGLLISSRDDPELKEKDDIILQTHDERMMSDTVWSDKEVEEVSSKLLNIAPRWDKQLKGIQKEKCLSTEKVIRRDDEVKLVETNQTALQVKKEKEGNKEEQMFQHQSSEGWGRDLLWCMWNILSFVSALHCLEKYLQSKSMVLPFSADKVRLPDHATLLRFYSKHLHEKNLWEEEFLDGFANDLLASAKVVCERHGGMSIQDFKFTDVSDVIVPLIPLEPYKIQCLLRKDETTMQPCGQAKMVAGESIPNTCYCQASDADDDTVCLLHGETGNKRADGFAHLCVKNSSFLSKSQTIRWFRGTVRQAWAEISHKYEFKVTTNYLDAPCALVIQFKSGRKLSLKLNPVVKLNRYAHLCITHFPENSDSLWTLSLDGYEDTLLDYFSRQLPDEACHIQALEIARFLHRRQVAVTGACALTDQHFKTALIHILLRTKPTQWQSNRIASRLRDLLVFLEDSLQTKSLHHAVVGNRSAHSALRLPAQLTQAKSLNLFHPLAAHECIYRHTVSHYKEILQSSHMLILDYMDEKRFSQ